mgnify:CR=1 FL=1
MAAKIEVLKTKNIEKGSLKGFASVRLGGVTIHDFRVIQQSGQEAWVSPPQKEFTGQDGKKKYLPIVELNDTLKAEVQRIVLEAFKINAQHGDGWEEF